MTATWQPPEQKPRDAELVLAAAVRALLLEADESDVYVSRKVPDTRRDRMVILTRDGGGFDGLRDRVRLRVRVWDVTDAAANDLAALVVGLMFRLVSAGVALHVEHLSGPLDVTDKSEQPQRYCLFEIHLRGEGLS